MDLKEESSQFRIRDYLPQKAMRRYSRKLVDDNVLQLDRFCESAVALRVIAECIVTRSNRTAATRVAEPDPFCSRTTDSPGR